MIAQRILKFGWPYRIVAIGLVAVGATAWIAMRNESAPSYGGRPSKSLDFEVTNALGGRAPAFDLDNTLSASANGATPPTGKSNSIEQSAKLFADALVRGDAAAAFSFLTEADQKFFGSAQQFGATLARTAPWLDAQISVDEPDVVATVRRTPQLDEALGLVTPMSTFTLKATEQAGTWRFDWRKRLVESEPTLDPAQARQDVSRWASSRQRCKQDARLEHDTGLLGVTGFANALCGKIGLVSLGDPRTLDTLDDPGPFVDGFGTDVMRWGRVVPMYAPIDMRVVVAPVGERWIVIGLARPEAAPEPPNS